jgi:hypothetical protein
MHQRRLAGRFMFSAHTGTHQPFAGVVGGIAALKALKDAGLVPARPLEVTTLVDILPSSKCDCSGHPNCGHFQ